METDRWHIETFTGGRSNSVFTANKQRLAKRRSSHLLGLAHPSCFAALPCSETATTVRWWSGAPTTRPLCAWTWRRCREAAAPSGGAARDGGAAADMTVAELQFLRADAPAARRCRTLRCGWAGRLCCRRCAAGAPPGRQAGPAATAAPPAPPGAPPGAPLPGGGGGGGRLTERGPARDGADQFLWAPELRPGISFCRVSGRPRGGHLRDLAGPALRRRCE